MGYIQGADRNQVILLPDTLDEYVNEDKAVTLSEEQSTWAEWVIVRFYPNQQHLRTRNTIVERPYGTVKRWHGASYLLTKGKVKVAAETGLSFLAYNFRRVINLLGVSKTISLIQA